jgi:hypothetical protein
MDDAEALTTIVSVLKQLDRDTQKRVLASVGAFVGVTGNYHYAPEERFSPSVPANKSASLFSVDRAQSPKEFIRDKQPATDVDRVACLAYYLTHYRDTPHFKTLDISALNVEAAQPKFSSASVAVENARAKGLLVPSTKGQKQISAQGERYVDLLPDRDAAKASLDNSKPRRSARKAKPRK